ncbi:MAG: 50S ribosomal protein L3 N(5)-glutamine methyltransferase [Gammaproteobacteria bacterium]|nr:50S ribosomal protein L3 N(5)-glutamine methyltransferase [Gammaproteobacteria bacterium]
MSLTTLNDCIEWGANAFDEAGLHFGHGTDNAWDEAVYLALFLLRLPYDSPREVGERVLTLDEKDQLLALYQRRITEKKPAPYLTHEANFGGMSFYVDERVLIPRSPMAESIHKQFMPWINPDKIKNMLDLCTGSGCIAVLCAEVFPEASVVATDVSRDALDVAEINLKKYHLESRVKLIKSDLFESIPEQKFDVIISNPPYVDKEDMDDLPSEYLHEPDLALKAGNDGLDLVKIILKQAKNYLSDDGILIVEVGNSAGELIKQFPDLPFIWLEFEHGEGEVFLLSRKDLFSRTL